MLRARAEDAVRILEAPARREQTIRLAKLRAEMLRTQRVDPPASSFPSHGD